MKTIEQELKLQLTKTQYLQIVSKAKDVSCKMQFNHYFYYDGMAADKMLRIRHVGDNFELTYKFRKSNANGVMVAEEYNARVDKAFLEQSVKCGIDQTTILELLHVQMSQPMYYIGCLATMRSTFDMCGCTVELDANEYLGVVDFELECEDASLDNLATLRAHLEGQFGALPNAVAKVQRFVTKLASMPMPCNGESNDN